MKQIKPVQQIGRFAF